MASSVFDLRAMAQPANGDDTRTELRRRDVAAKAFVALLLAAAAWCDSATAQPSQRAAETFTAQDDGEIARAIEQARRQRAAGRLRQAEQMLRDAAGAHPESTTLRLGLARLLEERAAWPELLALFESGDAASPEASALRICARAGLKQLDQAEAELAAALERTPDHSALLAARAFVALERGQAGLALRCIDEARLRAPPSPELFLLAARAYWMMGDALGATRVREVPKGNVGQFDGDWLLVEPRGRTTFLCAPRQSAAYQVRKALDSGLDHPELHRIHAAIWRKLGRPAIALAILEAHEGLLMDVDADATLAELAALALECNRVHDFLRRVHARFPPEAGSLPDRLLPGLLDAVDACLLRNDRETARSLLLRTLETRPNAVEALIRLGDLEWDAGDQSAARRHYTRALQIEPAHAQRQRMLGRLAP